MKITKLRIKNMFGITEYSQDGESVVLSGVKGTGKTSVIDAIKVALKNRSPRDIVLRGGTEEGEIIIETDTGISIKRGFRQGKVDSKMVKDNGKTVQKPEEFLRSIFTELQLNPVEFVQMDSKEQNRLILDLINYEWDHNTIIKWFGELVPDVDYSQNILNVLRDIQADDSYYFLRRQDVNRDIKNKKAMVEEIALSIPDHFDCDKWENANLGKVYKEIETRTYNNNAIEKAKTFLESLVNKRRGVDGEKEIGLSTLDRETSAERVRISNDITRLESEIKMYTADLSTLEEKKQDKIAVIESEHKAAIAKLEGNVEEEKSIATGETKDVIQLKAAAENTETMKSHINEYKRMRTFQVEVGTLQEESERYTEKIEYARILPGVILEECEIPIEGLTIVGGKPLINGLPINNLSDGEKLELCVTVALQKKSGLTMLLLDGLEKLDTNSRKELFKTCKSKGVQFICTVTDDNPELTVVTLD